MSRRAGPAVRMTLAWIRLYTRGLSAELRDDRRAELESDVWEQMHDSPRAAEWAVVLRCLLGVPADVSWRLEHARPGAFLGAVLVTALARVEAAGYWVGRKGLPGLAILMSWLYLLAGAFIVLALPFSRDPQRGGLLLFGLWCLVAGGLMWWGNREMAHGPRRGATLVLAGAVPIGLALWMTVVAPVATGAVAWNVVRRARSSEHAYIKGGGKRSYLPILHRPGWSRHLLPVGGLAMITPGKLLDYSDQLLIRASAGAGPDSTRKMYVRRGAALGLATGVLARIWMRTISGDPRFTVGGTLFILLVFSGLGALAGLTLAWQRLGTQRRGIVVRGAAWAPFLFMGPFMPLFYPSLGLALLRGRAQWGRWRKRLVRWSSWTVLALLALVLLNAETGPGLLSAMLYLVLVYALYLANRLALASRSREAPPRTPDEAWWSRTKANHMAAGA